MTTSNTIVSPPTQSGRGASGARSAVKALVANWGSELAIGAVIVVLAFTISLFNDRFFTYGNLINIIQAVTVTGIAAIGATLIIVSGHLDLSVGSTLGFSGLVGVLAMQGAIPALGIAVGIGVGALVGVVNGLLVTYGRVNAFIATLGMLSVVRGLALITTNGAPQDVPESLLFIGQGKVGGVPVSVIILICLVGLTQWFLSRTVYGRRITAVGDNQQAAFLAGIPVRSTIILSFVLAGVFAAIAGIVNASNLTLATTDAGTGLELDIVAAVIVGGTSLMGGRGSVIGALLGSCLLGLLRNAFVLLHLSAYLQVTAIGVVIILATLIDQLRQR
ncbi:ABC transporter permease [Propionicimonas sp.]|uniref:ABC transporter permease n=1 Tax=Propionicimonas sp. TaxID=1955623 RepID=UPI001802EAFB|nr:ABC transporter permease [Propionicimonas sp.]MBU3976824.1 ABC transporter permease [Actinomycetota bacterium]MBA3019513.1 ABC transporter permease [Propionicimonas sp.]MBU3986919.1 ABC transporter permease [Actinomycetota bacterium]MBU4006831.1 ABC transporter permease [Actinomycetota bacterium]MBU4065531.1 ABC transporter permease [Actinomycetota bacterium]